MSKKQAITWRFIVSLGLPLIVVGAAAMAISYATLIDVAQINGLPLPELFPILVDVGTVAAMVAAAQFKLRGIKGRPLAYVTFIALSGVSIVANAVHATNAADLTKTSVMFAAVLAATPPATLLAVTHLVMMLIPTPAPKPDTPLSVVETPQVVSRFSNDQLQRQIGRQIPAEVVIQSPVKESAPPVAKPAPAENLIQQPQPTPVTDNAPALTPPVKPSPEDVKEQKLFDNPVVETLPDTDPTDTPEQANTAPVVDFNQTDLSKEETIRLVLLHIEETGTRPTGAQVAKWLGKTPRTGHRFLTKLEEDNIIQPVTGEQKILMTK